jgi:hypothetical protein
MKPIYVFIAVLATSLLVASDALANRISTLPEPEISLLPGGPGYDLFSELVPGHEHDLMRGRHSYLGHGTSPANNHPGSHGNGPGDNCGNCQGNSGNGLGNGGAATPPAVPEPGTFIMLLAGLLGLAVAGGRFR